MYPLLRKFKIDFDPVSRIFMGFMFASFSMVYACVLQYFIYKSEPNSIHVWIQAPSYVLVAFSEAFVIITGLELAFTQAPKKSVTLLSLLTLVKILTGSNKPPFCDFCPLLVDNWHRGRHLYRTQSGLSGPLPGLDVWICFYSGICCWLRLLCLLLPGSSQMETERGRRARGTCFGVSIRLNVGRVTE